MKTIIILSPLIVYIAWWLYSLWAVGRELDRDMEDHLTR
jgi:hypothetical protein